MSAITQDYSIFRDFGFPMDPYFGFRDHVPATGLSQFPSRRSRPREVIIPIQVEGRGQVWPSQQIDLTFDSASDNINNSSLHNRSRNRRRNQISGQHLHRDRKFESEVSSFTIQNSPGRSKDSDTEIQPTCSSSSQVSQDTQDVIDLCMLEDMSDPDVYVTGSHKDAVASCSSRSPIIDDDVIVDTLLGGKDTTDEKDSLKATTPCPSYPVYKYLKSELARNGRLIDYIRGDGNCFFRALSKEIYNSEDFHEDVRQAVVDLIEKYPKEFEQFLDSGITIHEHIKEMRKTSTWASSAEIYAAATLVQRDIYVLSPNHTGEEYSWMLFKPRFIYTRDTSYHPCFMTLCHTHGNHYDRITPGKSDCNCDHEPPALSGVHAYVDLTK